jgi:hypothetical protein
VIKVINFRLTTKEEPIIELQKIKSKESKHTKREKSFNHKGRQEAQKSHKSRKSNLKNGNKSLPVNNYLKYKWIIFFIKRHKMAE